MPRGKNTLILVLALGWAATVAVLVFRKPEIPEPRLAHASALPLPDPSPPEPNPEPEAAPDAMPPPKAADLPDLSDLSDLSDLPDLSDLSDLSDLPDPSDPSDPSDMADSSDLGARLAEIMAALRDSPGFQGVAIGLAVLDPEGTLVFSDGGDTAMIPASALKAVTAATALEQLGVEFVFETEVRAASKPDAEGTLAGDLILRGGGDPTLSTDDLARLAEKVRAAGVVKIAGRVLADARFFPEQIASDFWNWGDIGNGYGSSAAGLNLNHNRFVAHFAPGATLGAPTRFLGAGTDLPGVEWINRVTTGAANSGDGVMLYSGPQGSAIHAFGTIPKNEPRFGVSGAIPDPPRFAAHAFARALRARGITVTGEADVFPATDAAKPPAELLATHASAPLPRIVRNLLKVSDNHESECLFRLLAARHGISGEQVVREHWGARGLDFKGLRMVDGSGLARANFIRPHDLARLLHLARRGEQGAIFHQSLNAHFDDRVRWKGGAMSSIRSWAGYAQKNGDLPDSEWTFALVFNHFGSAATPAGARDRILKVLLAAE